VALRFTSLGSGSEGNSLLVEARDGATTTRVLLDCGFSLKETERRLARLGVELTQLDAILITHEHTDHIGCGLSLARRVGVPIHMSWGTAQAVSADRAPDLRLACCANGQPLQVGDLLIEPYTVPHDAREPLQFTFSDGATRLGVLTDIGAATPHVTSMLDGCDALVLECNHDSEMLAQSRYPYSLKARIAGSYGHLSNAAAAGILEVLDRSRLRYVVAAHLSQQNNTAALAGAALAGVLGAQACEIVIATQEDGFAWLAV
jgi:phosphoribosyl 1,2-cyclic phosphodiesterase